MTDLTRLTATELNRLYQSGTVSPVAVVEQILSKIERLNPRLNALCFTDPNTTIAQAKASQRRWQQGQPLSALDGVPVAVKDSILTLDWPTRHASRAVDPNQSWSEDAPSVSRLREAGAVFVGKTTMPEFAWGTKTTASKIYGTTANPWNIGCSPGGSSGGSAAVVAGSLVPLALGTDLGGSITVPASFCGVFGYKPSANKVAHSPRDALNLCTVGLFARSVKDLVDATNLVSKFDSKDWSYVSTEEIKVEADFDIGCLCIGTPTDIQDIQLRSVFDRIKDIFKTQPIDALQTFDLHLAQKIFSNISSPVRVHQWQSLTKEQQSVTEKHTQRNSVIAHSKSNLYNWLLERTKFIVSTNQYMRNFDVIVVPATISSAADIPCRSTLKHDDINLSPWSTLCTVTGLPSVTIPVGLNVQGLPMALMIIGPMHGDAMIMQIAQVVEMHFPMPPCPVVL